jgi:predicted DNA binding CopG/RHH family protein
MKNNEYSAEELELLDTMENQPLESVPNLTQEIAALKTSVKDKYSKRKSINLRLLEDDLQKIKIKAMRDGIPYQTLIGSILHKYAQEPLH